MPSTGISSKPAGITTAQRRDEIIAILAPGWRGRFAPASRPAKNSPNPPKSALSFRAKRGSVYRLATARDRMAANDMAVDIQKEIAALRQMTVHELRRRHVELFGEENRSANRQYLFHRIAWRLQALAGGDLSQRARWRLHRNRPRRRHPADPAGEPDVPARHRRSAECW